MRELPGVGRYTAGAIASIVFGRAEAMVDGNVERVLARVLYEGQPLRRGRLRHAAATARGRADTWERAGELVRLADRPGVWNEALMELGATICLPPPARARCEDCPLAQWCQARKHGVQDRVPPPRRRTAPREVHHHAVIITRERSRLVLLERRNEQGMWSGLWQPPTLERDRALSEREIATGLRSLGIAGIHKRGEFTHATSHRAIRFHVYRAQAKATSRGTWRTLEAARRMPMSAAHLRVLGFASTDG